ncbi:bifunctional phosphopantothenoylcysteine decarboxylase/phosphopantothenate--cysteine ligase CoaBC [Methylovirgula sp. 4M-Z18]|uniref:bifunctional phosphopantothenoylcysteine decarboxylase/phosphopantothenate--cysteine ligase CoaBC n=1 Tax=Methylovirgula sp. 4M-Z18 TaxID=2293567 RepID=UPI000E2F9478|nr:bifunctional phosphopantothenoylcysteine decarboxylase/phosphopantothenate--cysteine ligase CoaBC [Methylovirgula sp. 4M-Z18]RFB79398.1 bifunctional phosphopantothenoylcysteine decarboxylase/phosphopantothenate--cysteine ligase CoaBC [Methylovirgula sp. 4M-Z18]
MASLTSRRILLIIGGGIAAYKALDLIRRLRERGASVRVVMTAGAKQFVTPLAAASLSGNKVQDDLFSLTDEAEMGHIELSRDADLIVIAPATADLLAKMANGLANELASTLLIATDTRVLAAPAMNVRMWLHPATQRNLETLRGDGIVFVGPNDGDMACGEFGPGRMAEPLEIVAAAEAALQSSTKIPLGHPGSGPLHGKKVLITAGPTHEPIDPVRYIANRSSGKQGYALAVAARDAGADVTLVSGPVDLPAPPGVRRVPVETARDMLAAVEQALPADIFIAAAAVADWRVAAPAEQKLKKQGDAAPSLNMVQNPDILAAIARRASGRPKLVVGFAAETEHVLDHAKAKLAKKGCDIIIANDVSPSTGVMGGDGNSVHIVTQTGVVSWPLLDKAEVARRLIAYFVEKQA